MARTRRARKPAKRTRTRARKTGSRRVRRASGKRTGKRARKAPRARKLVFAKVWSSLGNELLRLLKKRGIDRKAIAAALAQDAAISRMLVERIAASVPVSPPPMEAQTASALEETVSSLSTPDDEANDYVIAARQRARNRPGADGPATEESADWRLF